MTKHQLIALLVALMSVCTHAAEPTISQQDAKLLETIKTSPYKDAVALLENRLAKDPTPALTFALATLHLKEKQHVKATVVLEQTLRLKPDFHRARLALAHALAQLNRLDECAKQLQTLAMDGTAPQSHQQWAFLAQIYLKTQRLIPAETAIKHALTLNPDDLSYQKLLLNILLQQRKSEEAASLARTLIDACPNEQIVWLALLNPALENKQWDQASELLHVACAILPTDDKLLNLQVSVALQLKQFQTAIHALDKLNSLKKLDANLILATVQLLLHANQTDDAKHLLAMVDNASLQLSPAKNLQFMKLKTQLDMSDDHAQNLARWQQLYALEPNDGDVNLNIAQCHLKLQQPELAEPFLLKASKVPHVAYEAFIQLANLKLAQNNKTQARQFLQKAFRLFPTPELQNTIRQLTP